MISRTDRVPVSTIAPNATIPSRTAGIRTPRSHKCRDDDRRADRTTSASSVPFSVNPPTFDGRNGNDDTGKPRSSKRRHSTRTAAK